MARKNIGALPLLRKGSDWYIVLITSRGRGRWILPKGNPEKGLKDTVVAAMEAFEEAGVTGEIRAKPIAQTSHQSGNHDINETIFPMIVDKVLSKWPEKNERKRAILPIKKGLSRIDGKRLRESTRKLLKAMNIRT